MSRPVIVVVGAGPGVSGSVARRFADEGYDVALLGAYQDVIDDLVPDLEARGATVGHAVADVTDEQAARHPAKVWTIEEILDLAAAQPPVFAPGTGFSYSNTNYNLLGLIIERPSSNC